MRRQCLLRFLHLLRSFSWWPMLLTFFIQSCGFETDQPAENARSEVQCLLQETDSLRKGGELEAAMRRVLEAEEIAKRTLPSQDTLLPEILFWKAHLQIKAGRIGTALEILQEGWRNLADESEDERSKQSNLVRFSASIGNQFSRQMVYDSALYYGRISVSLSRLRSKKDSVKYAEKLQNLAIPSAESGNLGTAMELAQAALRIVALTDSQGPWAAAEINLADIAMRRGKPILARTLYSKALNRIPTTSRNRNGYVAFAYLGLASKLDWRTDAAECNVYFQEALCVIDSDPAKQEPRERGKIRLAYARFLLQIGKPMEALAELRLALLDCFPTANLPTIWDNPPLYVLEREPMGFEVIATKAAAMASLKQTTATEQAVASYRHAFRFADGIRRGFANPTEKGALMALTYPVYDQAIDFVLEEYARTRDPKYKALAFEWIERSKANDLLDQLTELERYQFDRLPDSVVDRGRELEQRIAALEAQVAAGESGRNVELVALNAEKRKLVEEARQLHPGFFLREPEYADVPTVQARLDDEDAVFISYFLGQGHIHVTAIAKDGDTTFSVPDSPKILNQVTALMMKIKKDPGWSKSPDEDFRNYQAQAYELFRKLLAPAFAMQCLEGNLPPRIVIAPDGALAFLPFEALVTAPADPNAPTDWTQPSYLVQHTVVSYVQSGSIFATSTAVVDKAKKRGVFGLGMSFEDSKLKNAEQEVRDAVKWMSGEAMTGDLASESNFKKNGGGHEIAHFATHGDINTAHPLQSCIKLLPGDPSEDGKLYLHEVLRMRLREDLAVLSACQSGTGLAIPGSGVLSMGLAFQIAGCPTVVQSLSNVNDEATLKLMNGMYAQLSVQHSTVAEALTMAKRKYLVASKEDGTKPKPHPSKHPYFWSLFVVMGNGDWRASK